jgi:hypothetical protein
MKHNELAKEFGKWKKSIAILPMCMTLLLSAQEGGFGYGTVLGIGQASVKSDGLPNATSKIAFTGGVATSFKFNKAFGLTLDITGVSKGAKTQGVEQGGIAGPDQKYTETYTLVDLDIPVMAKAYIGSDRLNLNIMGGVGMNFNLLAFSNRVYEDAGYNEDNGYTGRQLTGINTTNLSYTVGLGLTARAVDNYYFIHLRTTGPLNSFGTINGNSAYHNNFNITFGYLFY